MAQTAVPNEKVNLNNNLNFLFLFTRYDTTDPKALTFPFDFQY